MKRDKVCGIYKIVNKLDGKIYVGQSIDVYYRMNDIHKNCKYLFHALQKFGRENFEYSILEICEEKELDEREIYWIKKLKSHVSEDGYNISWGGNATMKGLKHSEESKKKISDAVKGENHPLWGTHQSEESKKKNRESQLGEKSHMFGKHHSDEMKQRLSKIRHNDIDHVSNKIGAENPKFGSKSKNATSKYFGVIRRERRGKIYWEVSIKNNGKQIWVGQRKTEIEAAELYNEFIIKNKLPHPLNKID